LIVCGPINHSISVRSGGRRTSAGILEFNHFVGTDEQCASHAELDSHPKVELHDYEGRDHGFATEMGDRRNDEGATLAESRTAAFFAEHLG